MNYEALQALEASIRHWERNVAAQTPKEASASSEFCALCDTFPDADCAGCPVRDFTGRPDCFGTPFYEARGALIDWKGGKGSRETFQVAAQAELDFLKSLRPEDEQATETPAQAIGAFIGLCAMAATIYGLLLATPGMGA